MWVITITALVNSLKGKLDFCAQNIQSSKRNLIEHGISGWVTSLFLFFSQNNTFRRTLRHVGSLHFNHIAPCDLIKWKAPVVLLKISFVVSPLWVDGRNGYSRPKNCRTLKVHFFKISDTDNSNTLFTFPFTIYEQ